MGPAACPRLQLDYHVELDIWSTGRQVELGAQSGVWRVGTETGILGLESKLILFKVQPLQPGF